MSASKSKRMKFGLFFLIITILIFMVAAFLYTRPQPLISDLNGLEFYTIKLGGIDVTEHTDLHALSALLLDITYTNSLFPRTSAYSTTGDLVTIDVNDNQRPIHIRLSEDEWLWYEGGNRFAYIKLHLSIFGGRAVMLILLLAFPYFARHVFL